MQLQTDITAVGCMLARAVAKASQLAYVLRISHESLIDRVHRIFKGKWILELTNFYLEITVFLPFGKQIYHSWTAAQVGSVAIKLDLRFPVEIVGDTSFKSDTSHADVEGIGFLSLLSAILILSHAIARQLDVVEPCWQLDGFLLLCARCGYRHSHQRHDDTILHLHFLLCFKVYFLAASSSAVRSSA